MTSPDPALEDDVAATWVPVERRWLGLDRSTIRPALGVLAFALVLTIAVPAIDAAVPAGTEIRAGDVVALGRGVEFVPAAGWELTDGVLAADVPRSGSPPTATVVDGPVAFSVKADTFAGTPAELLARIKDSTDTLNGDKGLHITGDTAPVQTRSGERGVLARYRGTAADGLVAAFVIDGIGVEVVVTGPPEVPQSPATDVADMLTSIAAGSA